MSAVIWAIVGYGVFLALMLWVSQPIRLRLVDQVDALLDDEGLRKEEIAHLEWLATSSTSSAVGVLLPLTALLRLGETLLGATRPRAFPANDRLRSDPRYQRAVFFYLLSILACSPIAALFTIVTLVALVTVTSVMGRQSLTEAAEEPVIVASTQLQPELVPVG